MRINGAFVRVHARDRHKPVSENDLAILREARRQLAEGKLAPSRQKAGALPSFTPQPGSAPMANETKDRPDQGRQEQQSQTDPQKGRMGGQQGEGSPPGQQGSNLDDQDDGRGSSRR